MRLLIKILCAVFRRQYSISRDRLFLLLMVLRNVYPELRTYSREYYFQDLARLRQSNLIVFERRNSSILVKPSERFLEECFKEYDKDVDELVGTLLKLRNNELAMLISLLN